MLFKARVAQIAHGIQTGVETGLALKSLYSAGQACWTLGRTIGAAGIPFVL